MNFAGHALVAQWLFAEDLDRHSIGFAAMIPDFARMANARPIVPDHRAGAPTAVRRGVDLHHQSDAVFHPLPDVVALMRELGARLTALGVRRGPMLATSHIGIEIMLDDAWLRDEPAREFYLACLRADAPLAFSDRADELAWQRLLERLRAIGSAPEHASAAVVTERVGRTLHNRPKLSADARDLVLIERGLASMAFAVNSASARIRSTLLEGLRAAGATDRGI